MSNTRGECNNQKRVDVNGNTLPHECVKNHDGSSKSMEPEAILKLVIDLFENRDICIRRIVSDDDCSMKKTMRHNYKLLVSLGLLDKKDWPDNELGNKKSSGKLPVEIEEPTFLADFNHRVKSVGRALYELAVMGKKKSPVTKDLAKRIKGYWSKILKQVKLLDLVEDWKEIQKRVSAPIEHIFNNHQHCQVEWCYAKKAQQENKIYTPSETKPFYCKKKDKILYEQLCQAVEKFQTKRNVKECLHSFDTQMNEAINNIIPRYVPKYKHFGKTTTLDTRIAAVVGSKNMGYQSFYLTLLCMLVHTDVVNDSLIAKGIKRIDTIKTRNAMRKKQ